MLCILTTHPIQYQVPIWQALAERSRVPFRVFYMDEQGLRASLDVGFGRSVAWDIDLVSGYQSEFIEVARGRKSDGFWSLRLTGDFGQRLRDLGVSVLWVQGWQVAAYWQAVRTARRAGVEVWLRGETNARSNAGGWLKPLKRALLRRLLGSVDRLLCVGEANRAFYASIGMDTGKFLSAPYCVDNARFRAQADAMRGRRNEFRQRWRIPENAFCILFAGKFVPKKRPMDLVRAVVALAQNCSRPIHLLWVGSGELGNVLRRETSIAYDAEGESVPTTNDQSSARVPASFVGFLNQTEISQAYVAADCLALPSDAKETWGLVVNEAMASGLPCVVSDACGCADDLIVPFRPDLAFRLGDIDRFAKSLAGAMREPPSPDVLRRIIDRYDYMRTVLAVEALYAETVRGATGQRRLAVA